MGWEWSFGETFSSIEVRKEGRSLSVCDLRITKEVKVAGTSHRVGRDRPGPTTGSGSA